MIGSIHVGDLFSVVNISYELILGWARYLIGITLRSFASFIEANLARVSA